MHSPVPEPPQRVGSECAGDRGGGGLAADQERNVEFHGASCSSTASWSAMFFPIAAGRTAQHSRSPAPIVVTARRRTLQVGAG